MIPSSAPPFFQIHKSQGIGCGINSVGTAAIKKLGVICGFGDAGQNEIYPIRADSVSFWERPSADQVNKHRLSSSHFRR
jgi:hypothetical protein